MTEIKLRAAEARDMANRVRSESNTARDQMNSLRGYLNNLSSAFTGQAAAAFDDAFNQWKAGADKMIQGLDALGNCLHQAADTIEEVDTKIASQLRS